MGRIVDWVEKTSFSAMLYKISRGLLDKMMKYE
jgi:hypothetical protein